MCQTARSMSRILLSFPFFPFPSKNPKTPQVTPTKLTSVPITIEVDKIEIVLSEKSRSPLPNVLGKLFKKSGGGGGESEDYGLKDKLGLPPHPPSTRQPLSL